MDQEFNDREKAVSNENCRVRQEKQREDALSKETEWRDSWVGFEEWERERILKEFYEQRCRAALHGPESKIPQPKESHPRATHVCRGGESSTVKEKVTQWEQEIKREYRWRHERMKTSKRRRMESDEAAIPGEVETEEEPMPRVSAQMLGEWQTCERTLRRKMTKKREIDDEEQEQKKKVKREESESEERDRRTGTKRKREDTNHGKGKSARQGGASPLERDVSLGLRSTVAAEPLGRGSQNAPHRGGQSPVLLRRQPLGCLHLQGPQEREGGGSGPPDEGLSDGQGGNTIG